MEQKLKEFQNYIKTKFPNGFVEIVDPTSPFQCFDLVVAYTDFLKIPRVFPFLYAYQIYTNFGDAQAKYFDRINNGPYDLVKTGDIVVWSNYYNGAGGHTAIATGEGDLYNFKAYEQNDPENWFASKNSHVRSYAYTGNVLGWLRPKNISLPLTDTQKIQEIKNKINTPISDTDYRNWERKFLGV